MRAIQYLGVNQVEYTEVGSPTITPGHVLLRVAAAGICQTDIHVRAAAEQMIPTGVVLGHEIAGHIVERADGVDNLSIGDLVVVHPVWSCGRCRQCVASRENACLNTGGRMYPAATPGISIDGGLAEFITVPASALVTATGLDPAFAAVLPDAGLVPYHSINAEKDTLRPGSTAVIIGMGGLGQFAVELLRAPHLRSDHRDRRQGGRIGCGSPQGRLHVRIRSLRRGRAGYGGRRWLRRRFRSRSGG